MSSILEMKRRFEKINTDEVIYGVMKDHEQDLNDVNLEQMYSGKNNKGENIRPSYLEDPYWDDHGGLRAAQKYSDWKDKITPNPLRNPGTPNLFINGYYHRSRSVLVLPGGEIIFNSFAPFNKSIDRFKDIDGLGGKFKSVFLNDYIGPVLKDRMEEVTGLKIGSI